MEENTHKPNVVFLPAHIDHEEATKWMRQLSPAGGSHTRNLNASKLIHFDSSAIALLLQAKRSGYALDEIPEPVVDLARLYGVATLLRA